MSLRDQMAEHDANPTCSSCHNLMDPLGLELENFEAVGRWREESAQHYPCIADKGQPTNAGPAVEKATHGSVPTKDRTTNAPGKDATRCARQ